MQYDRGCRFENNLFLIARPKYRLVSGYIVKDTRVSNLQLIAFSLDTINVTHSESEKKIINFLNHKTYLISNLIKRVTFICDYYNERTRNRGK